MKKLFNNCRKRGLKGKIIKFKLPKIKVLGLPCKFKYYKHKSHNFVVKYKYSKKKERNRKINTNNCFIELNHR